MMDLGLESSADGVIVEWEQATTPETDEVWRSINGGAFARIAEVSGALSSYEDMSGMSAGDEWCYIVRAVTGETQSGFSNEWCAAYNLIYPGTGAVSLPTLRLAFGDLGSDDITQVTSLDLSGLKGVLGGTLYLDASTILTSVDLSSLVKVTGDIHFSLTSLTSLSLPSLTTLGGSLYCDNTSLVTISIPNLVMLNGKTYAFDSSALSAATIAHILARAIASGVTSASIFLDGGTNAGLSTWSAQAQADYAILVALGNTMSSNP